MWRHAAHVLLSLTIGQQGRPNTNGLGTVLPTPGTALAARAQVHAHDVLVGITPSDTAYHLKIEPRQFSLQWDKEGQMIASWQ